MKHFGLKKINKLREREREVGGGGLIVLIEPVYICVATT
jgi:hypothetical protein